MCKRFLCVFVALSAQAVYAENFSARDPSQVEVNTQSAVDQETLVQDLKRHQQQEEYAKKNDKMVVKYTGKQLIQNPEILEELFLNSLIKAEKLILPMYSKLYQNVPNADPALLDWAKAILLRDVSLSQSVAAYRELSAKLPNNDFIRYQLAETLFYNQEFEAAKGQFERLRASAVAEQDINVFDDYLNAINHKADWNFSFSASLLNDKNLGNAAKEGTTVTLANGGKITYDTPRQSGQGISLWLGADK